MAVQSRHGPTGPCTQVAYDSSVKPETCSRAVGVAKLLSRNGSTASLMAAIDRGTLMAGYGKHFSNSQATDENCYSLSRPVESYTTFVSHAWVAPRFAKYLAFVYRYSLVPALISSFVACAATTAIVLCGALPPVFGTCYVFKDETSLQVPLSIWTQLISSVSFTFFLLHWTYIRTWLEKKGILPAERFFLDKLCICQSRPDLKQQGIDSIGTYLQNSDELLILWSREYFTRLWCCFEVAVFLGQVGPGAPSLAWAGQEQRSKGKGRGDRSIVFLPLHVPLLLFWLVIVEFSTMLIYSLSTNIPQAYGNLRYALTSLPMVGFAFGSCWWVRSFENDCRNLDKQLSNFTVAAADCSSDKDRVLIRTVIAELYSPSGDVDEGIANFELAIRTQVRDCVGGILGTIRSMPLLALAALMTVQLWCALDFVQMRLRIHSDNAVVVAAAAHWFCLVTGAVPAQTVFMLTVARLLPTRGAAVCKWASNAAFALGASLPYLLVSYLGRVLRLSTAATVSTPIMATSGVLLFSAAVCLGPRISPAHAEGRWCP